MRLLGLAAFLVGACLLFALVVHAGLAPVLSVLGTMGVQGLVLVTLAHLPIVVLLGLAWWTIYRSGERPESSALRLGARCARRERRSIAVLAAWRLCDRRACAFPRRRGRNSRGRVNFSRSHPRVRRQVSLHSARAGAACVFSFRQDRGCGGNCPLPLRSFGVAVSAKAATAAHKRQISFRAGKGCAPCGAGRPWRSAA